MKVSYTRIFILQQIHSSVSASGRHNLEITCPPVNQTRTGILVWINKKSWGSRSRDFIYENFIDFNLSVMIAQVKAICGDRSHFNASETRFATGGWRVRSCLVVLLDSDQAQNSKYQANQNYDEIDNHGHISSSREKRQSCRPADLRRKGFILYNPV